MCHYSLCKSRYRITTDFFVTLDLFFISSCPSACSGHSSLRKPSDVFFYTNLRPWINNHLLTDSINSVTILQALPEFIPRKIRMWPGAYSMSQNYSFFCSKNIIQVRLLLAGNWFGFALEGSVQIAETLRHQIEVMRPNKSINWGLFWVQQGLFSILWADLTVVLSPAIKGLTWLFISVWTD